VACLPSSLWCRPTTKFHNFVGVADVADLATGAPMTPKNTERLFATMDTVKQTSHTIEFTDSYPPLKRFLVWLAALIGFTAVYGLLIAFIQEKVFEFDASISYAIWIVLAVLSSIAVALLLSSHRLLFDASERQLTHQFKSAFTAGQKIYSFDQIESLKIRVIEWESGPDTYGIALKIAGGPKMRFGEFRSRSDAERYLTILQTMVADRE